MVGRGGRFGVYFYHTDSITGRSLAIVPRDIAPQGYFDLQKDDFAEGDVLTEWQNMAAKVSHRSKLFLSIDTESK